MLSINDGHFLQHSPSRREWLRVGGLNALGLSLPTLLQAQRVAGAPRTTPSAFSGDLGASFGKARNVDKNGAYPATTPITGGDLTATIFHLLGIDPSGVFLDKESRPHPLTKGEPIAAMLGDRERLSLQISEGDPAFVPPFDTRLLFDTDFRDNLPLVAVEPPSRTKGWRAWSQTGLTVAKSTGRIELLFAADTLSESMKVEQGPRAILAQEIRNARGGQYTFRVQAAAVADSADEFEEVMAHFRLRLVLFRFQTMQKDPRGIQELATADFRPVFGESREFVLDRFLGSTTPGANFSIGCGLGVLIAIECTKPRPPELVGRFRVRLESVELKFNPPQARRLSDRMTGE